MSYRILITVLLCLPVGALARDADREETRPYTIVDTGQIRAYDNRTEMTYPKAGAAFFGQDAHYQGVQPSYRDNGNGTVSDLNTGLMWQADPGEKRSFKKAKAGAAKCRTGGHRDWRLPSIKELYSLILFSGTDPDPMSRETGRQTPFIDTSVFEFAYGSESDGERIIDSQYASSTRYVGTTMGGNATVFGANFADGRIKGYPEAAPRSRGDKTFCVLYVRGNPRYGRNDFKAGADGTVTDRATGLVWMKVDSGALKAGRGEDGKLNWQEALAWAEKLEYAGHDDWRLPNAKELQSIVDYTRSPDTTRSAAIDPVFESTPIENEGGQVDYAHYWTGTSHVGASRASAAVYFAFGRALGFMSPPGRRGGEKKLLDVHGAGAQRSDDKSGDPSRFPEGRGPQGDVVRIENLVRCVRGGKAALRTSGPKVEMTSRPAGDRPERGERLEGGGRPGRGGFVRRLDKDGDGKVSREEFDGPPRAFDRHDENGDGYLTEDEAPSRGRREGRSGRRDRPGREPRESRDSRSAKTLEVVTIGTGSPLYNEKRSRPSMLVTHGDTRILVDMGEGTEARLEQAKIKVNTIDAFCFTHHHRDHNADAMSILPLAWQRDFKGPIIGPEGTGDLVEFLRGFYAEDLAYRMKRSGRTTPGANVIELPRERAVTVGGVKITTVEVPHSITTFAYRFEAGNRSIVVSGDLSYTKKLAPFAKNADILVMDSGGIVYEGEQRRTKRAGSRSKKARAHGSLEEVAKMAADAKAKKLVLVHFRPGTVDEAATRTQMAPIYKGEIVFAADLQTHR